MTGFNHRQLLVAVIVYSLEENIQDGIRKYGSSLKKVGIEKDELLRKELLDMYEDAVKVLRENS